jgi:hypothetical protein
LIRVALLAALLVCTAERAAAAAPSSFDYLYVRAHEGNASGGHAAIRFGDAVFDFQHEGGLVLPRRMDARHFQHRYRTLENRGIERSRIAASAATTRLLGDTFERRVLVQSRQVELAEALARDAALLERLAAQEPVEVAVRGAAFFAPAAARDAAPALAELRDAIARRHGADWHERRSAESARALREAGLDPPDLAGVEIDPLRYPAADESLARRLAHALAVRRALEVLAAPHGLASEVVVGGTGIELDDALRADLTAWRATLVESATRLAASPRPDWGEAWLLAAARIAAIDVSLASGVLLVLDALPASARSLGVTERRRALVPALLAEANGDLTRARRQLGAGGERCDARYADFEAAATRVAVLRAVEAGAVTLRIAEGTLLPEGVGRVVLDPRPVASELAVASALDATRRAEADLRRGLAARYGYDLVRRNCVTEIFRTVELALGQGAVAGDAEAVERDVRTESERRLGGHVDPEAGANFVPFVSSRAVRAQWSVADHRHLDSAREHAVARGGSLAAALRESNTITASFYEPADHAGFFVFFADSPWPLRPIFGALNLAAAVVRSGVGLATLPFDRGAGLRHGLDGALWSVPELGFANVRKGTSDWVPPKLRPPTE